MKKLVLILSVMLAFAGQVSAQDAASVTWSMVHADDYPGITAGQLTDGQLTFGNLQPNSGGSVEGATRICMKDKANWVSTEDASTYLEYSVTPKEGNTFTATTISMSLAQSGTKDMRAKFYISTDPDFKTKTQLNLLTDDTPVRDTWGVSTVTLTQSMKIATGERIYLRVYPYFINATPSATKYIHLKDVTISGTTESVEMKASVNWPFVSDLKPVVSGALVAQDMTYGSNAKHYGWDARVTINNVSVNNGTFCTNTNDCAWSATTEPVSDIYVQYAVSPKTGATFTIKEISLMIAATSTNSMAAAVYGSKDANFGTKTELKAITDLANNELDQWNITLATPEAIATGETYYLRIYPFSKTNSTYKLIGVRNVTISGSILGATFDPAEVSTGTVSYISTTTALIDGNVTNDGGATVTGRGIVWNTETAPTTDHFKTTDGEGTGVFTSKLEGLSTGTIYYARAYATNVTGTSYGEEISFTTLAELTAPSVETSGSESVQNTSIVVKGNVTEWGGTEVTERGIVWGTEAAPTENKTIAGNGLGSFKAQINGLTPSTKYIVRAYAINSTGTAYGDDLELTTKVTDPDIVKTVDLKGSGDYTTIQAAFDAVPSDYTGRWIIKVMPGTYNERATLEKGKVNVYLAGQGKSPEETVITHNTAAGTPNPSGGTWGTSKCQTVAIDADDFMAVNITFENTFSNSEANVAQSGIKDAQAVALRTQGDRQSFFNCRVTGFQDTYLGNSIGRAYFKECYIKGNVDFIFGRQTVVFDQCKTYVDRDGSVLTAPSTELSTKYGMVFLDCKFTAPKAGDKDINGKDFKGFYYGRPWQKCPRTAVIRCDVPSTLNEKGWTTMSAGLNPVFVEYGCTGEGATTDRLGKRGNEGKVITAEEAALFTIENVFKKETDPSFANDWKPKSKPDQDVLPSGIHSETTNNGLLNSFNAPNPFTESTTIYYTLNSASNVSINLYGIDGTLITNILNEKQSEGKHMVNFNASGLAAGIYSYTIRTDERTESHKIIKR